MKRPLLASVLIITLLVAAVIIWRPQGMRVMPISSSPQPLALRNARQMILVTTADWSAVTGHLRRFVRGPDENWHLIGDTAPIVVGRAGLAWGRGANGLAPDPGPTKREGDGKAPAGVFSLRAAFGYASPEAARFIKLPYTQATTSIECVDDMDSTHYNRLVDRTKTTTLDWKSSEQMLRNDEQYRWGLVVDHNANSPVPGGGSCIFLHIWAGSNNGTSGCTAMESRHIEELLGWLEPAAAPVLVQLPQAEFSRLQQVWGLPASK